MGIKHTFVSLIPDAGNPDGTVDSDDWNADHTVDGDIDLDGNDLLNVTNINGSPVVTSAGISEVADDTTPTLGGSLDGGGFDITNVDDATFDTLTVTDEAYDATGWDGNDTVPTKNAIRDKFESLVDDVGITEVADDTSPTLGGSLDGGGFDITNVDDATFDTLTVTDEAYDEAGWNADLTVPTKNAVRDIIESILGGLPQAGFNVVDYGAVGDGVTDDSGAFQDAIDAMIASYTGYDTYLGPVVVPKPPVAYLLESSLNFQDITGIGGWGMIGLGRPTLHFKAVTDGICLDILGSNYGVFRDFIIHGDTTDIGEMGISTGKKSGSSKGSHSFSNIVIRGYWSTANMYIGGSEVNTYTKMELVNPYPVTAGHCLIVDGMAHWTPNSAFASPTMTTDTAYSCILNHFIGCSFRRSGWIPIALACPTQIEFNKCYAFGDGDTAIEFIVPGAADAMSVVGDYNLDIHVEPVPTSLTNQITFSRTTESGPLSIDGLKLPEQGLFPTNLVARGTNVSRLTLNGDINWRAVGGSRFLHQDSEIIVRGRVNNILYPNPPAFFDQFTEHGVDQGDNIGLVVDPADYLCYPGTGQTVFDRSSNAVQFTLGNTSGSSTDDPTFTGSQGALDASCYFACDGGDFLRATANTTAIQNMHKDSALFRIGGWFWVGSTANQTLFDTLFSGAGTGIRFRVINTTRLTFLVLNAAAGVFSHTSTSVAVTPDRWNFITLNIDEAAGTGFYTVNYASETFSCTYTSPAAGNATSLLRVGAMGNGTDFLTSDSRIGPFWLDEARTIDENFALFEAQRHRFGI